MTLQPFLLPDEQEVKMERTKGYKLHVVSYVSSYLDGSFSRCQFTYLFEIKAIDLGSNPYFQTYVVVFLPERKYACLSSLKSLTLI